MHPLSEWDTSEHARTTTTRITTTIRVQRTRFENPLSNLNTCILIPLMWDGTGSFVPTTECVKETVEETPIASHIIFGPSKFRSKQDCGEASLRLHTLTINKRHRKRHWLHRHNPARTIQPSTSHLEHTSKRRSTIEVPLFVTTAHKRRRIPSNYLNRVASDHFASQEIGEVS